jgi:hypothetical protein
MDSWLFPTSKKVYICIFWSSITKVVTVGLTSVKKKGPNLNFLVSITFKYLVDSIFEYGIHFPIAHRLIESRSVFGA